MLFILLHGTEQVEFPHHFPVFVGLLEGGIVVFFDDRVDFILHLLESFHWRDVLGEVAASSLEKYLVLHADFILGLVAEIVRDDG